MVSNYLQMQYDINLKSKHIWHMGPSTGYENGCSSNSHRKGPTQYMYRMHLNNYRFQTSSVEQQNC